MKFLYSYILILLLIISSGCNKSDKSRQQIPSHNSEEQPAYGDVFIDSSIGDAKLLNPILAGDSASANINDLVFNGLVKYDKDIVLVSSLAKSWEISEDGLVYTFHLRKNVKWHDGMPFTADDVEFTYKKLIDPSVMTPRSSRFLMIEKFEVLSPYDIRVTYKEAYAPALESWGIEIIPKHIFKDGDINTHPANRKPIGTGPFKFIEWKTDEKIVLEANPEYFEGMPFISRVIFRIIPDQTVQFLELKSQNIDSMALTPDQYQKETASEQFKKSFNKFKYPSFSYTYLGYNLRNPLFEDKRVRQAISYAVNKKSIIDGVLIGLGKPATGPFPPKSWAYNPNVKTYDYNPIKAKELLSEAGWNDTDNDGIIDKDGKPFKFTIITNQGNKMRELTATIIQENLMKIGIKVNIRIIEWSTFVYEYVNKRKFEAVLMGWSLSMDPDCYVIWHSSQTGENEFNFISYNNPEVDKLLDKGRKTFNINERKQIYYKIHEILAEDQPYTFLYVSDSLPVVHKRFHNISVAATGIGHNFIRWYVPSNQQKYVQ